MGCVCVCEVCAGCVCVCVSDDVCVSEMCVSVWCVCGVCVVCVCEWEDRREEGGADTALKTKNPHVNVGNKNHPLPPFRQVSRRRRRLWDKNSRNRWIDTSCPKSQCTAPAQQRHGRVVGTKEKTRLPVLKGGVAWATAIHRGAAPWEIKAASSNS